MKRITAGIVVIALGFCFPTALMAETIVLKSGKTIEGKIINRTNEYIEVDVGGMPLKYYRENIQRIGRAAATEGAETDAASSSMEYEQHASVEEGPSPEQMLPPHAFAQQSQKCRKQHSAAPTLTISVEKDTYSMGERIPVIVTYENTTGSEYTIAARTREDSGRLPDIAFYVNGRPKGFRDPLAHHITLFGGIGGVKNSGPESFTRYSEVFDLNEWVRFDAPGVYHFYCSTSRVHPPAGMNEEKPLTLCSQIITITILPTDEFFIEEVLHDARKDLRSANEERRLRGVRTLRFLSTHKSVNELIPLLDDEALKHEAFFGIIGCRDRTYARNTLWKAMKEPYVVVNDLYLTALSLLMVPQGEYSDSISKEEAGQLEAHVGVLREKYSRAKDAALERLEKVIGKKSGRAAEVGSRLLNQ